MSWTSGIVLQDDERWLRCFFPEAASNYDVVGISVVGGVFHAHRPHLSDMQYGVVDENTGNSLTGVSAGAYGYVQTDGACTVKLKGTGSPAIASGGYLDVVPNEYHATAMDGTYGPSHLTFAYTSAAAGENDASVAAVLNSQIYRQHDGLIGG